MTVDVAIERKGGEVYLTVEATVEWVGRGRFARVHDVTIDSATCTCGHEVTLTREEEQKCIDALREQAEIEQGDSLIDQAEAG